MITVTVQKVRPAIRVITAYGELLPGSQGIDETKKIESAALDLTNGKDSIVFDFRELKYTFGNYIGGIFFRLLRQESEFNIVATGETKIGLNSLIDASKLNVIYEVNIFENLDDAIGQFGGRSQPVKE